MKNIDFHTQHTVQWESVEWLLIVWWWAGAGCPESQRWSLTLSVDSSSSVVTRNTRQHRTLHVDTVTAPFSLPFIRSTFPPVSPLLIRNDLKSDLILVPLGWLSPLFYVNSDYVTLRVTLSHQNHPSRVLKLFFGFYDHRAGEIISLCQ